jgi:hypothetical protein
MPDEKKAAGEAAPSQGFDAMALSPNTETTEVVIFDPKTRKDTDIVITVYGRDSKVYKQAIRAQVNRRAKNPTRRMALSMTAEDVENETLDLLCSCTAGWRGVLWDGKPLPFSGENARLLYERVPIIREQVDEAIADRNLFLPR